MLSCPLSLKSLCYNPEKTPCCYSSSPISCAAATAETTEDTTAITTGIITTTKPPANNKNIPYLPYTVLLTLLRMNIHVHRISTGTLPTKKYGNMRNTLQSFADFYCTRNSRTLQLVCYVTNSDYFGYNTAYSPTDTTITP